jgi:hypothetical protein
MMTRLWRRTSAYASVGVALVVGLLLLAPLVRPVAAASDNTNLIQQILATVQRIEAEVTGFTGLGGSFSALQSDVTAIKSKTDNLPNDTATVLNEINANTGSPLTHMFMKNFVVHTGETGSMTCSSTGPFLLHVHAHGIHADIQASLNGTDVSHGYLPVPQYFVLGGNASDAIALTIQVANEFNPNAYGFAFVTMQTTEGSVLGCN